MTDPKNEVLFCEYCKTCKHKLCDCEDEPCCDCLAAPVNYYSHKPVLWEGVDTLFNKPQARVDHAANREVRELTRAIDGIIQGDLSGDYVNETSKSIVRGIFGGYGKLRSVTFSAVTSIGDSAFYQSGLRSANFPEATYIGRSAFNGCTSLKSINLPKLTTMSLAPFIDCSSLQSIELPMATTITNQAFKNCSELKTVYIPSATRIDQYAFNGCASLENIEAPEVTLLNGDEQFTGCPNLKAAEFPKLTTMSGKRNFYNCSGLKTAIFPELTSINGEWAFKGCTALTDVYMPKLTSINRYYPFSGCSSLVTIDLPSLKTTDDGLLSNCSNLEFASLPSVTTVFRQMFAKCSKLQKVVLGNITSIEDEAFTGCTLLEFEPGQLAFVESIDTYGLHGLESVESFSLPSVKTIKGNALQECINLKSVYIPKVESLGGYFLQNDYELRDVYITEVDVLPTANSSAFDNVRSNYDFKIHLPVTVWRAALKDSSWMKWIDHLVFEGTRYHVNLQTNNSEAIKLSCPSGDMLYENDVMTFIPGDSLKMDFAEGTSPSLMLDGTDITDRLQTAFKPKEPIPETISTVSYGFKLNANGYYESTNKGISNSAAVCKINFNFEQETTVTFDIINSGESGSDYGIIGKVDKELAGKNLVDNSSLCAWTGRNKSSTNVVKVNCTVPAGKHFIYMKYRKDGSVDQGNDSLQFKFANPEIFPGDPTRPYYTYTLENIQTDHDIVVTFGDAETETEPV